MVIAPLNGLQSFPGAGETAQRNSCEVLHRVGGCGMVTNDCAVVLKETRTAALLLELPKKITEHDGFGQRGREVTSSPVIALRCLASW